MSRNAGQVIQPDVLRGPFRLVRTEDAAVEPISVTDMKAHLRVDISDDDSYIGALITAARQYLEEITGRALITQTWRYSFNQWYEWEIELPRAAPLQSVSSIQYYDVNNALQTLDSAVYQVDTDVDPGRIRPLWGQIWPSVYYRMAAIQVTFVAGYGDAASNVPAPLIQAIRFLVGHWYENRASVDTDVKAAIKVPDTFAALVAPYDCRVLG